jgi:hypothetical protein
LIARLHAFYGRAPGPEADWLKVRAPIFWAYARMLDRLEAEDKLAAANLAFATEGQAMEDFDRTSFLSALQMAARGSSAVASYDDMEAAGIEVVYEEAPEAPEPGSSANA